MATTVFDPRPLPDGVAAALKERLARAHADRPFSPLEPRATVARVTELVADLPLQALMYRGGLDLRGVEVDHVWLGVGSGADPQPRVVWVVDVAFPLFEEEFVAVLRRFVAGDAEAEELEAVAGCSALDARVVGEFPAAVRYRGRPTWSARQDGPYDGA